MRRHSCYDGITSHAADCLAQEVLETLRCLSEPYSPAVNVASAVREGKVDAAGRKAPRDALLARLVLAGIGRRCHSLQHRFQRLPGKRDGKLLFAEHPDVPTHGFPCALKLFKLPDVGVLGNRAWWAEAQFWLAALFRAAHGLERAGATAWRGACLSL